MYYTKLTETSACGFSPPPEDRTDLVRVIELVLEAERCAIEKYNRVDKPYGSTLQLGTSSTIGSTGHVYILYPYDPVLGFKDAIKWVC